MLLAQIDQIEAGIHRIAGRSPGLPVADTLILRYAVILGRNLSARLDQRLKPTGLAEMEFRVLLSLYSETDGTTHPGDLCAALAQSPANLTRASDALVQRGLITRELSEQDRRRMVMRITPEGERLVQQLLPPMFDYTRDLLKDFSTRDKTRMVADLKRLLIALDADPQQATPADGA